MNSTLAFEIAVGVGTINFKRRCATAGPVSILVVNIGDAEALIFCPTGVHAQQHFRPVACFGAACARLNIEVGI